MKSSEYKSKITIFCKDSSVRVINVVGRWSQQMATQLGQDIEMNNFWQANVVVN